VTSDQPTPTRLVMTHEWRCFPLWDVSDPEEIATPVDPAGLPLSPGLVERLNAWSDEWDRQLDWDDPGNTEWDEARLAELDDAGRALAREVAQALPGVEVTFRNGPGRAQDDAERPSAGQT
jgi:hypothetical protein